MKLGLLVVMAMVILAPSLSDGGTVSKCELKEMLWKSNILPKSLPDKHKEKILAIVICELNRRSHLNTSHEEVLGQREMTTDEEKSSEEKSSKEMSSEEMTSEEKSSEEKSSEEITSEEMTSEEKSSEEKSSEEITSEEMTSEEKSSEEKSSEEKTSEEMTSEEMTSEEKSSEEKSSEEITSEEMTSEEKSSEEKTSEEMSTDTETTDQTSQTILETGKKRRKRDADMSSEEELTAIEMNLFEMVNLIKSNLDEVDVENAENRIDDEDDDSNEAQDDNLELGEDGESNGEAFSMTKKKKLWSLGSYGIFQLSDGYCCNSGYRWSINKCNTSCKAFADEDITDDIACLVKTGFWRRYFYESCSECIHTKDYFKGC